MANHVICVCNFEGKWEPSFIPLIRILLACFWGEGWIFVHLFFREGDQKFKTFIRPLIFRLQFRASFLPSSLFSGIVLAKPCGFRPEAAVPAPYSSHALFPVSDFTFFALYGLKRWVWFCSLFFFLVTMIKRFCPTWFVLAVIVSLLINVNCVQIWNIIRILPHSSVNFKLSSSFIIGKKWVLTCCCSYHQLHLHHHFQKGMFHLQQQKLKKALKLRKQQQSRKLLLLIP